MPEGVPAGGRYLGMFSATRRWIADWIERTGTIIFREGTVAKGIGAGANVELRVGVSGQFCSHIEYPISPMGWRTRWNRLINRRTPVEAIVGVCCGPGHVEININLSEVSAGREGRSVAAPS